MFASASRRALSAHHHVGHRYICGRAALSTQHAALALTTLSRASPCSASTSSARYNRSFCYRPSLPVLNWAHDSPLQAQRGCVYEDAFNMTRTLTLNRPKQLNSLNLEMIRYITPHLKMYSENPDVIAIILQGNPYQDTKRPAFCAGGDVMALYKDPELRSVFFREEYTLNFIISTLQTPYLAFLNGITMGGGVGLSVHGRYRAATELTLFAMPETAIGFFPDVGGTHFLPRLDGELGMFLGLTGHRLHGADVAHARIATHYIPSWQLTPLHHRLDELHSGMEGVEATLDAFNDKIELSKPFSLEPHLDDIDECFSAGSVEEILDRLHARNNEFCRRTAKTISQMSPTSLKVTFRALRKGASLSMEECMRMEYRLSQRFMKGNDFFEGVRAVLKDKDNNPQWSPSRLAEVSKEQVDAYFAPFSSEEKQEDLMLGYIGGKSYRLKPMADEREYFLNELKEYDFRDPTFLNHHLRERGVPNMPPVDTPYFGKTPYPQYRQAKWKKRVEEAEQAAAEAPKDETDEIDIDEEESEIKEEAAQPARSTKNKSASTSE